MNPPPDIDQRIQALDATGSFICEAPAGSGKTELLTQRVLTLLARVEQPEAILAITFTRKAAAEMRARILKALAQGSGPEPISAHERQTWLLAQEVLAADRHRQWHLLDNPGRLPISTFDSLCAQLTKVLPLHASLGADVRPTEDDEPLLREAARTCLEGLEQEVPWQAALSCLMAHLDNRFSRLEDLLVRMLRRRASWLAVIHSGVASSAIRAQLQAHLQQVLLDKVDELRELIPAAAQPMLLELAGYAGANLKRAGSELSIASLADLELQGHLPDSDAEGLVQWQGVAQLLLTSAGEWRARMDKRCGFPSGVNKEEKAVAKLNKARMAELIGLLQSTPGLLAALQDIRYWPEAQYEDRQWQVLEALTGLLPVLVAQLQLVFRARGQVDFTEMSQRALMALGTEEAPTDLALRLDHRIQHILVDEFQDTSHSQVQLLQQLTAGWQPDDGRTVFCVGDAMQSIYGFRGADVGLFLHSKAQGLGSVELAPLQLTANFRSQGGVVEWINRVFLQAFPPFHDITAGAVAYASAHAVKPPLPDPAVQLHLTSAEGEDGEATRVLTLIESAWQEDPEARVAVLVRNRGHARAIAPALKQAGLRYRAVDLEPLSERMAVRDLVSLTWALLAPGDRIVWWSVLRAPWCGLTLADLHAVAQHPPATRTASVLEQVRNALGRGQEEVPSECPSLSADGRQRLSRVWPLLLHGVMQRQRKTLRQWVEGVWLSLGGAAVLQDAVDLDNVERFFQLLESLEAKGQVTPETLQEALADLYAAPDPEADERLQIMTIHKSKGLEFDVVILPGLHRSPRAPEPELLLWQERLTRAGREQLLLAPISAQGQDKDPIYQHLEREQKKRQQLEACRLLYVACTRARNRLHLVAQLEADKKPAKGALLTYIWPYITEHETVPRVSLEDDASTEPLPPPHKYLERLPAQWSLPELPEGNLLAPFVPRFEFDNNDLAVARLPERPQILLRLAGTLVHEVLQHWLEQSFAQKVQQGFDSCAAPDMDACRPGWRARLLELGVRMGELDAVLARVEEAVRHTVTNKRFAQLLADAKELKCEYPVSSASAEGVLNRVVDVLLIRADGSACIVDYKIANPTGDQSTEAFLQAERHRYESVMIGYAGSVASVGYAPVTSLLFFPLLGRWVEY